MPEHLAYVYAIVPRDRVPADPPDGLDGSPVSVECEGDVCALISRVPAGGYSPAVIETSSASLDWMGPRARAHDAVVTWASDRGATVPLPMFSMFATTDAVHAMLRERGAELVRTLAHVARGREYTVRAFVLERELRTRVADLSPALRTLEQEAEREPPGKQFLLRRKADAMRKAEAERVVGEVAAEVRDRLGEHALEMVEDPLPDRSTDERGGAILNASFLVTDASLQEFRAALTHAAEQHEKHGFRFEFTGPWPPYHFVRGGS